MVIGNRHSITRYFAAEEVYFSAKQGALFKLQLQIVHFESLENNLQIFKRLRKALSQHNYIIQMDKYLAPCETTQYEVHNSLKRRGCIAKALSHSDMFKQTILIQECSLMTITVINQYLPITRG